MLSGRMVRSAMAGVVAGISGAALAQGASLALLSPVQAGQWELREVGGGSGAPARQLCVADARTLLQVRHAGASCSQVVLSQSGKSAVVNYTCPRLGHGRTEITVDNGEQVRLETQGIADGAPFDVAYDAHRLGACNAAAAPSPRALTAR